MLHVKLLLSAIIAGFTVEAVDFYCFFSFQEAIAVGRCYTCETRATVLETAVLENVNGDHRPGKTNDDVDYLKVQGPLPFVPAGIVDFFGNLRAINIDSNEVFSVSAEDLRPFHQLEFLALFMNHLESIEGDLFSFTPHLKCIALAYNQIKHIGHDLVTNLLDLQFLYLNGNICVDRNAVTRAEVEELAPQLSELCPPIESTTTVATTTETPAIAECSCNDEIIEIHDSIQQQSSEIMQLQQSNAQMIQANEQLLEMSAAVGARLAEVERLLGAARNFVQAFCIQG